MSEYLEKVFKGRDDIYFACCELSELAKAFDVTGNTLVANDLNLIVEALIDASESMVNAVTGDIHDSVKRQQEAHSNFMNLLMES